MYGIRMFYGPILSGAGSGAVTGSAFGPIGAAAGAVLGAGISAFSQGKMNKKTREWNEKMYALQRQHALDDWAMQNQYNSPQAQMERLKAAGLNPNMVYGTGSVANSTQSPRSSSPGSWNPKAPDIQPIAEGVFSGLSREIQMQQLKNLKTQQSMMEADIVKKSADALNIGVRTDTGRYNLDLQRSLKDTVISTAEANLRLIGARNEETVSRVGLNLANLGITNAYGMDLAKQNLANAKQTYVLRNAANARADAANFRADAANTRAEMSLVADLKLKAQKVVNMLTDNAKTFQEVIRLQESSKMIRRATTLQDIDIYLKSAGFDWKDPVVLRQLRMSSRGYSKW